jgi:hypothetical protein
MVEYEKFYHSHERGYARGPRIKESYLYRLCGLVVRVPGYRSRGPGSIPGATRFFSEK